jgi:hypothetical protein
VLVARIRQGRTAFLQLPPLPKAVTLRQRLIQEFGSGYFVLIKLALTRIEWAS